MSGNGEQIDLNSEVHGVSLSHPVVDSVNEKSSSESRLRELGNDEAMDVRDEAADVEFLEGRSIDSSKEMEMDAAVRVGEDLSMAINELSEAQMESSERRHLSESIISVGIERDVEIQEEGVCAVTDAQIEELGFGSVDLKCDQVVKQDYESHSLLDHEGSVDVHVNMNPEGSFCDKDVDGSSYFRDNLGSDFSKSAEDGIQLTDNLDQKAENLTESNELPPPVLASDCSENRSGGVDGGHTIENSATGSHILKTEALTDLDESNLFDVVVEVDPHVMIDEDDISDDSDDSVAEFNVSDLVWSRVPSHPWWPGQICDPTASSKKAMKYFKTGRYLVAFYGDHTFSWKEAVMIKPFQEYFLELQKQSNLKSFHEAIDRVLEEFSRRVEFSLACTCLSEELYSKIQTQTLTNAGIRKKFSKRVGGDSSLTASSFDPMKLINIVKQVAMSPFGEADKLELVRAQAQLLSINRWKGYYELPKFDKHIVVFNDTNHHLDVKNDYESETMVDIVIDIKHDEASISGKGDLKTQDRSSVGKHKRNSEDLKDSGQKGKNLSNSPSKKPRRSWKKKHESEENADNELVLHASSIKNEVGFTDTVINIPITQVEPGKINQTFRVGDRIQKVAYKLTESNPILKHNDGISQKAVTKTESNPLLKHNDGISQKAVTKTGRGRKRSKKLCLHMDLTHPEAQEALELVSRVKTDNKSTKTRKRRKDSAPIEASDSEFIKDTYWTDMLIQGITEDQISLENQNETVDCNVQTPSEKIIPTAVEQDGALCPGVNSTIQDEPRERVEPESENCVVDPYPTALILTFTDLNSVPSETNLNDIFRKYGPLYEPKTEVIKNSRRARVVFKRTSDAEAAFSSTGKYSIFGTALVSYRLKFLPPTKVSPSQTRRGRKKTKP